ncbi:MAG TPA: hypothetical protein VFS10_22995 [Pyrinomonadaceae bacterium]|nr:hypothetical protein [Pyrinomonadaceae bacterium]
MTTNKAKNNKFFFGAFAAFLLFCLFFFFFFFGVARAESKKIAQTDPTEQKQAVAMKNVWKEDAKVGKDDDTAKEMADVKISDCAQKAAAESHDALKDKEQIASGKTKSEGKAEQYEMKSKDSDNSDLYLASRADKGTINPGMDKKLYQDS